MVESVNNPTPPDVHGPVARRSTPFSRKLLSNIASPYGLALISYTFFLFACLIPPSIYTHYMAERDLMFLDPATLLLYTLCVLGFIGGASIVTWLSPSRLAGYQLRTKISPELFLMAPLIAGILATMVTLSLLLIYHPDIILLLLAAQGQELKGMVAFEVATNVNLAPLALSAIVWWAYWRSFDLPLKGWKSTRLKLAMAVAVLLLVITATLILSRDVLVMPLCGLAILYVIRRSANSSSSFKSMVRAGTAVALSFALLFFAFAFLRGSENVTDQVHELFGYTVASYNRLAAIVNGDLRFPFAGRGFYFSSFVTFNRTFNKVTSLGRYMGWPDQSEIFGTEFDAVTRAGLDGHLVWPGTFGCIFSDFGWFCVPILFAYGLLYGLAWNWIRRGKTLGVVLYPCLGFCALFWIGSNALLDSQRAVMLVAAIFLAVYERLFAKNVPFSRAGEPRAGL